ncbi:tetratricopeptide repeat-containing diguanylate cyclase [Glaciecola petra]|uniref:diguanylate cyclase n=1 Tax=Glaciecola petra TaxID=3075602 RepID=A0ABU2ZRQ3_9ALTE|nr:GGDEF domain-containing protein [Aestuariibacter sp. P117]MDT0594999.1 GGDEF domain-containing protein [Aestuariibacter sp. P117]
MTSSAYGAIIEKAYELRSANPKEAQRIIKSVNRDDLKGIDRDRFDYIHAYLLYITGDIAWSITAFERLVVEASDFDQQFAAYASLANLYGGTQKWAKGFKALEYLSDNIQKVSSIEAEEHGHMAAVNFYTAIEETESVVAYIQPLLEGDYSLRFSCMIKMHWISAVNEADYKSLNEEIFTELLTRCEELNEPILQLGTYQELAFYYLKTEQVNKAFSLLSKHLDFAINVDYKPLSDEFHQMLSIVYLNYEEFDKAKFHAEKVLENLDRGLYSNASTSAYETLSKVAVSDGDYRRALEYYKKYSEAKSFVLNRENAKLFSVQRAKQESVEKSNKIALLDKENSLLKANVMLDEQSEQNQNLIYILILVLLLSAAYWIYKSRSNYQKLQKISRIDGLTDIANRHYFTDYSIDISTRNAKDNRPVSFIMFDLDDFKKINDTYGHRVGDVALKSAANAAKIVCRKDDLIGRLGGEEFGIMLSDCTIQKAVAVAEACRTEIERAAVSEEFDFKLTASFGISGSELVGYDFDNIFDNADKALYESKTKGKNTVSVLNK